MHIGSRARLDITVGDVGVEPGVRLAARQPGGQGDAAALRVTGPLRRRRQRRYTWRAGPGMSWHDLVDIPQRDPGIQRCGDERVPQRVGPDRLVDPGTAGEAADDPARAMPVQPPTVRCQEDRPSTRSPTARSIARAVRGASGTVTTLPPLRVTIRVRWPRSTPSASMSAPVASETRSPFRASSEISTCSPDSPDRRRPAERRVRCGPGQWRGIRGPAGADGHAQRASDRAALLRRRTGRTRRECTGGG